MRHGLLSGRSAPSPEPARRSQEAVFGPAAATQRAETGAPQGAGDSQPEIFPVAAGEGERGGGITRWGEARGGI